MIIYQIIVIFFLEEKLSLPHYLLIKIDDEVVDNNSCCIFAFSFSLIGIADCQQLATFDFPNIDECAFYSRNSIILPYCVLDLVVSVDTMWVISEIEGLYFELLVMAGLEPNDLGVVISLADQVLIGPFIFF